MGKLASSFVESAYRPGLASTYELSILLGVDSSSYLLKNDQQQVVLVETFDHPGELPVAAWTAMSHKDILRQQYRKVKVGWGGLRQTLVPGRLYTAEQKKTYLEHLTTTPAIEEIAADFLPDFSVWNVYAADSACRAAVQRTFPHARFYHLHTALLPIWASGIGEDRVYAHYDGAIVRLFAFKHDRLVYANAFLCMHARDFLYYVLLIYEVHSFRTTQIPLYLAGRIVRDSDTYRLLFRYLSNVNFAPPIGGFLPGDKLSAQPAHLYIDLMALQLCD